MINLILLLINIFINKKIMNAYFFNITNEERNNILDKHKEIYDGYVKTVLPLIIEVKLVSIEI